eukprot:TRINITY_DN1820_c0_g1_i1.p1 TRINITY_DN1820_c0_g1~~TRINITY_DN1820_c0_g1_i1.p1  ORF type:complete len:398 (-),score=117.63 TRINITY_DN1820_c0_g1_i1:196-1389(-)
MDRLASESDLAQSSEKERSQQLAIDRRAAEIEAQTELSRQQEARSQQLYMENHDAAREAHRQQELAAEQKAIMVKDAEDFADELARAKAKQQAEAEEEEAYEMRKLAQTRPGMMRLLDTPLTTFSHIVDDEIRSVRQTHEAYNERRMCDEAETFVLVRRVEIELDREARMRGEVEEALRVELRKHNLEYYADELHHMGAERRTAERQRDAAQERLEATAMEAHRLKQDGKHMREQIDVISGKLRIKARAHEDAMKKADMQARVDRENIQFRYDHAKAQLAAAQDRLHQTNTLGHELRTDGRERQREEDHKKEHARADYEQINQRSEHLNAAHAHHADAVGSLSRAMDLGSRETKMIGHQAHSSTQSVHSSHERQLQDGAKSARRMNTRGGRNTFGHY